MASLWAAGHEMCLLIESIKPNASNAKVNRSSERSKMLDKSFLFFHMSGDWHVAGKSMSKGNCAVTS